MLASASFWSTLLFRKQAEQPPVEAEPGPSHVSLRRLSEEFPFLGFLARAVRNWKYGALFPYGLIFGSHVSCVWVSHVEYTIGFFGRCCDSLGAMAGSTVDTCSHQYLALSDEFCTLSKVKWTRILRFSVSVLTQNGEVCSADASALSPGMRARTWNLEITSTWFTCLAAVMMAGQYAGTGPCKLVPVTARCIDRCGVAIHTHQVVSETTTTNTQQHTTTTLRGHFGCGALMRSLCALLGGIGRFVPCMIGAYH